MNESIWRAAAVLLLDWFWASYRRTVGDEARHRAGLSQGALARRAGVPQSVISVYECGGRQPALPTLAALIAATGHRLNIQREEARGPSGLTGPLGRRLRRRHVAVRRAAERHGITMLGVVNKGERPGTTDVEHEEIKRLKREVAELRRANEILKAASAFFAAELDRPQQRS